MTKQVAGMSRLSQMDLRFLPDFGANRVQFLMSAPRDVAGSPLESPLEDSNPGPDTEQNNDVPKIERQTLLSLIGLCLALMGVFLDGSIITVGLPQISADFNSMKNFGWLSGGYLLAACSIQPIFGRFYALGHRINPLLLGVALYQLGAILCAFAGSEVVFIVGRLVSGSGAASLYVGSQAIIVSLVSAKDLALCLSIVSSVSFALSILGPVICGALVDLFSWRVSFLLTLPFSFMSLVWFHQIRTLDTESSRLPWLRPARRGDILGTMTLLLAFAALFWTSNPGSSGSLKVSVWVGILAFAALMVTFTYIQYNYGSYATIPPYIFIRRYVWASAVFSCFLEMAIYM